MVKKIKHNLAVFVLITLFSLPAYSHAQTNNQKLYQTALPYTKYFTDRALDSTSGFQGLTRSFQLYLGSQNPTEQSYINYGAANYDQSILARISLNGGITTILDTYVSYFKNSLNDYNNPLINTNGNYYDANSTPLKYGLYRLVRILGRSEPNWWGPWDWIVDTGANACFIIDLLEAYQQTQNIDYKNLAIFLGDYILKLQDTDGGIRYGPRGMYHDPEPFSDFYWNLKSSEQNERSLYAFDALYQITQDAKYTQASNQIKNWLKGMYDASVHLYHSAATFSNGVWQNNDFSYVATDVMAFAPLSMMFRDTYFGTTQQQRDAEVDAMFSAIETRTAFLDISNKPMFFRFSVSETGDYGSVEMSSQMALAYLRAAQIHYSNGNQTKSQEYLNKYNSLVLSLEKFFVTASDDASSKVAPYASYLNGSVAGGVPTGTGYYTYNCQAALASAYYAFAKSGYDPTKLGGGTGIPNTGTTLNMIEMPWYQNTAYNSTGAAVAQMLLNYIRQGAGVSVLDQNTIYQYARSPLSLGPDLTPDQMDKTLGHFDPYDSLVSNSFDTYDSLTDGNPYQGYNYIVDTYDPALNANAFNDYIRDICHWMAYTVTKEEWWKNGELVAKPNTPAAVPIYGTYNHWVAVKGFATSANPCPDPRTNPFNTPDFTVYGLWVKDSLVNGIGTDTYKTAAECRSTYFLPLSTGDSYNEKFVQVAEPAYNSKQIKAKIKIPSPDFANLEFVGLKNVLGRINRTGIKKKGWQDIVDSYLLSDKSAQDAFKGTTASNPILVKRLDKNFCDYYLVPFSKLNKYGLLLVSGVIILDANDGHFKEASWTQTPERLINVDKVKAMQLIQNYVLNNFWKGKDFRTNILDYCKLLRYIVNTKAELVWQPNTYSSSPYKPYWKINANGYIWYVTQEGKVIPEKPLADIIKEIKTNRIYLENLSKNSR